MCVWCVCVYSVAMQNISDYESKLKKENMKVSAPNTK